MKMSNLRVQFDSFRFVLGMAYQLVTATVENGARRKVRRGVVWMSTLASTTCASLKRDQLEKTRVDHT